ncbi:MAG TPA: MBL fold metallo-hydrolase, partial [Vicinamibacterales bacterium]|nr:MBL fold metallo-hydrolase [Vicinamibacterales bacterium]
MLARRTFLRSGAAALGGALLASRFANAQAARIATTDLGGAWLFHGAGGNVVALPGSEGALMIDGGRAANAQELIAAVQKATGTTRIHTLINTHWHPDQVGANEAVGKAVGVILAHEKTKQMLSNTVYNAIGVTGRVPALPAVARPNKTVRLDGSIEFPGQQIDYGYMPAAHTDGDIYVHVPKLNLLVVGGVVSAEEWPLLDYQNGAWLGGRVRGVEHLADLVKPDTRVIPSTGRMMTGKEILRHRDIYQKLYSTLIGYLNKGLGP